MIGYWQTSTSKAVSQRNATHSVSLAYEFFVIHHFEWEPILTLVEVTFLCSQHQRHNSCNGFYPKSVGLQAKAYFNYLFYRSYLHQREVSELSSQNFVGNGLLSLTIFSWKRTSFSNEYSSVNRTNLEVWEEISIAVKIQIRSTFNNVIIYLL